MDSYLELLKANSKAKEIDCRSSIDIVVLNNITTNPIKEYLEYNCAINHIEANVSFGDYDNISQNAKDLDLKDKAVIVFWELANCLHGLEYKIDTFSEDHLLSLEQKIKTELQLTFKSLSKASLVVMNKFSALPFTYLQTKTSELDSLADRLNSYCEQVSPVYVKWVNTDKCLVQSGIEKTIDFKGYLKNKLLYKHLFYWNYTQLIQPYFNALTGQVKKLLALDCDNTLWKGVIGEDGADGIAMDENQYKGQPFAAAQYRAMALGKKGTLLALASKNNEQDVDEVLRNHNDIVIKDEALVAKKVNWESKANNLKKLSQDLNIGVDSFVFVDDSDFEVQLMIDQNPSVKTIQVNKNAVEYYVEQQQWPNYFLQLNESTEDLKKLDQYKQNVKRASAEENFNDFNDFLESLGLELVIYRNDKGIVPRMAQMTQKTNQFNLTTPRYSESQIEHFLESDLYDCFAFAVKDKFGDSGITGLCIINYAEPKKAVIDTLLMSCRILGRTIEFKFMDEVLSKVFEKAETITGKYVATKKNQQVEDFYSKIGFDLINENHSDRTYSMKKATFASSNAYNYIKLNYV